MLFPLVWCIFVFLLFFLFSMSGILCLSFCNASLYLSSAPSCFVRFVISFCIMASICFSDRVFSSSSNTKLTA